MIDYIKRHSALFVLVALTWLLVGASKEVTLQTALTVATFEGLAIFLVYVILYVLSPVNWLKELEHEMETSSTNRNTRRLTAALVVISVAILSVHILCGFVVWGVYFTRYSPMP